jgi:antitoxin MazE
MVGAGVEEGGVDNGGMALQCRSMKTSVQRWGNSLAVRIPRAFAAETRIEDGTEVELLLKGDDLVVRPVRRRRLALSELLKKVTPKNQQDEVSSGAPVGQEIW